MVSGMAMMILMPRAAAMAANPMPVLPDVGSMRTVSWPMRPSDSALSTIAFAMRSFTDPPGLNDSTLATILAFRPWLRS